LFQGAKVINKSEFEPLFIFFMYIALDDALYMQIILYLCTHFRITEYLVNLVKNKKMNKAKSSVSVLFMLFSILFCVCLIAANVLETKQILVGGISLTGGLLVFPVSYIINDCVCEVWGYGKARLLIWIGFAMNFFFVSLGALCDAIPGAPYWTNDAGFHAVFGLAPRIALASFIAFIAGSFVNAYIMSRMKIRDKGRNFSARAILSTVFGETADSILFFPLALGGVVPLNELPKLMLWQVVLKTVYEIVVLPVTIKVVKFLKSHEGEDAYDAGISYNILKIFNI
jgi:queuosine precursor transporter